MVVFSTYFSIASLLILMWITKNIILRQIFLLPKAELKK